MRGCQKGAVQDRTGELSGRGGKTGSSVLEQAGKRLMVQLLTQAGSYLPLPP